MVIEKLLSLGWVVEWVCFLSLIFCFDFDVLVLDVTEQEEYFYYSQNVLKV